MFLASENIDFTGLAHVFLLGGGESVASFDEIQKLSAGGTVGAESGGPSVGGLAQFQPVTSGELVESGTESKLLSMIEKLKEAFGRAFDDISEGARALLHEFRDVWDDIRSLGSPLASWFSNEFTDFLKQFIYTIRNTLEGLYDSVRMVFSDLWNIVIFPSVQKWAQDILPAMTEFGTNFLETFDVLFDEVKTIFDRVWSEGVAPALSIMQEMWSDFMDSLLAVWEKYGEPIFNGIQEAVRNVSSILQNVWETVIKPVWDTFMETVDELWAEHLKPLLDNFLDLVGKFAEGALSIFNECIAPLVNWFVDEFGPPITSVLSLIISTFGKLLGTVADVVSGILTSLGGVIDFLVGVFTGDWDRAWNGVKEVFKNVWNGIVGFLEGAVNIIIDGVNWLISKLNTIHFEVPDWVPLIGGNSWGINIQPLDKIEIPRLAQGAVIPPNREFLAVLGDQKQGTNIETPLNTMVQAFKQALREMGMTGESTIILEVDGQQFGKAVFRHYNSESRRVGATLISR